MEGYDASTYGERIAEIYDRLYDHAFDVDATVETLVRLARGGRALELAIGTGRIAIPLSRRSIDVQGIDASEAMVARMRAKPGGDAIVVTFGDFADVDVGGRFDLVYIVFNTLFALVTQEAQIRCFRNVADHLGPNGVFVVEGFVPDLARFDRDQRVQVTEMDLDEVMLDVSRHDAANQRIDSQHIVLGKGETRLYPVNLRYAWPSELDLMARLAGLRLAQRWGGWRQERFTAQSSSHVSIYERA
ncbi:MAG: class I SAM-dependent methyltransferase [Actinomycetota bacterium]